MEGLQFFSDIGLHGSIVHHQRGDEERFLNTAWTLQVIRGAALWLCMCLLAWPAATFYEAPSLIWMIPVMGLATAIQGFESTAKHTLVRRITPGKQVAVDLSTQFMALVVMIAVAVISRSVWALVAGGLFRAAASVVWSHFLIPGYTNRFAFDRSAARFMLRFGKWVLVSTALTFLLTQGDRMVLGKMISASDLGVYTVAFFLSQAVVLTLRQLAYTVLLPVYATLARQSTQKLRRETARIRAVLMVAAVPPLCALAIWGKEVVGLLYDDRFSEAGWMLQILAARSIGLTITVTSERVLLAVGNSFRHMLLQIGRAVLLATGMAVGGLLAGVLGLLIGMVAAAVLEYPVLAALIRRYGVWLPKLDLLVFGLSSAVIGLGLWLS